MARRDILRRTGRVIEDAKRFTHTTLSCEEIREISRNNGSREWLRCEQLVRVSKRLFRFIKSIELKKRFTKRIERDAARVAITLRNARKSSFKRGKSLRRLAADFVNVRDVEFGTRGEIRATGSDQCITCGCARFQRVGCAAEFRQRMQRSNTRARSCDGIVRSDRSVGREFCAGDGFFELPLIRKRWNGRAKCAGCRTLRTERLRDLCKSFARGERVGRRR